MKTADPGRSGAGRGELRSRVVSALVMAIGILLTTWIGGWPFRLVWIAIAGLVAYEWLAMVGHRHAASGGVAMALAGLALAFLPLDPVALAGVSAALALIGAIAATRLRDRHALEACGIAYASVFALVTPVLRMAPGIGLAIIIWTFAVVWFTDIAAFFTGRALGGPKLMPSVSPKKTWSGAIGGAVAGSAGGYAVWAFTPGAEALIGGGVALIFSVIASALSQAGDLFESAMKRRFGTKDSSTLIPGHGGFLDRLDGYWSVLVLAGAVLFLTGIRGTAG